MNYASESKQYRNLRALRIGFRHSLIARLTGVPASVVLSSLFVLLIHVAFRNSNFTMFQGLLSGLSAIIVFYVIANYFDGRKSKLPLLEWAFFQYYVFFVMPIFMEGESSSSVSFAEMQRSGAIDMALFANILLFIAVIGGWILGKKFTKEPRSRKSSSDASILLIIAYGFASILVTFFVWRYEVETQMSWYGFLLKVVFSPFLAQALLLFESAKRKNRNAAKISLTFLTLTMVIFGALSSRLNYVILPLVIVGIASLVAKGRVPIRVIFVALIFLIVLNPAKHIYRSTTGYRTVDFEKQTLGDLAEAWLESITTVWSGSSTSQEEATEVTASRLNYLDTNATVMFLVPSRRPFEYGWPWRAIPYSLIPRFLWKDKPSLTVITNDAFAITMGISTEEMSIRSTSPFPLVSDGYWNFGWLGVILVGLIEGLLFAMFVKYFDYRSRFRYSFVLLYVASLKSPNSLSNAITGIAQLLLVCFVVIKILEVMTSFLRRNRIASSI